MPQLLYPNNPKAMGIEVGLLGYLFGLPVNKSVLMGVIFYFYEEFVIQRSTPTFNIARMPVPQKLNWENPSSYSPVYF